MNFKKIATSYILLFIPFSLCSCNNQENKGTIDSPIIIQEVEGNNKSSNPQILDVDLYSSKRTDIYYRIEGKIDNNISSGDVDYFALPLKYDTNINLNINCDSGKLSLTVERLSFNSYAFETASYTLTNEAVSYSQNKDFFLTAGTYYIKIEDNTEVNNKIDKRYSVDIHLSLANAQKDIKLTESLYAKNIKNIVWINDDVIFSGKGTKELNKKYVLNKDENYNDYLIPSLYNDLGTSLIKAFEFYILDKDVINVLNSNLSALKQDIEDTIDDYQINSLDLSNVGVEVYFNNRTISLIYDIPLISSKSANQITLINSKSELASGIFEGIINNILNNCSSLKELYEFASLTVNSLNNLSESEIEGKIALQFAIYMQINKENSNYSIKYIFDDYDKSPVLYIYSKTDSFSSLNKSIDNDYNVGSFKIIESLTDLKDLKSCSDLLNTKEVLPNVKTISYKTSLVDHLYYNQYIWYSFTPSESKRYVITLTADKNSNVLLDEYNSPVEGYSKDGVLRTYNFEYHSSNQSYSDLKFMVVDQQFEKDKVYYYKAYVNGDYNYDSYTIFVGDNLPEDYIK